MNNPRINAIKECLEQIKLTEDKKVNIITNMLNGWTATNSFTVRHAFVEEIMISNQIKLRYCPVSLKFRLSDTPKLVDLLNLELTKLENQNV